MTYAPANLLALRSYLVGMGAPVLGIVGNPTTHRRGYHLGRDRIYSSTGAGDLDYSVRTTRDKAGLTNAAAAIDIGRHNRLIGLGRHLLLLRPPDVRELIAERSDGSHLWRWDSVSGRVTGFPESDELYHHLHISYFRDSEYRDKLAPFRAFYGLPDTSTEVDVVYTIKGVPGPFPATVKAGTPYYSSPEDKTANGTIDDPSRPFTVIAESKDGARRAVYGRMQVDADRAVIGWVDSKAVVR